MDLKQPQCGYAAAPAATSPDAAPPAVWLLNATAGTALGPLPQRMTCPSCRNAMQTRLERRANKNTHLIALLLCITGLFCLVPLPYCLKSCRSVHHYCGCCNQYLGRADN